MPRLKFLISLLSLISCFSVYANENYTGFSGLDTENGLSNNSVNCILQDSRGYMWFSTYYGLNRYDGYNIISFYSISEKEETLSSNFTTKLIEDEHGHLWIGTKFGLNKFNKDTERFKRYWANTKQTNALQNNHIGALLMDHQKRVWVGTMGGGLHCYQPSTDSFECFAQNYSHLPYINFISALTETPDKQLWVGTHGNGISLFTPETNSFTNFNFPAMEVNSLLDDGNGSIWIATDNMGLYRFDKSRQVYERFDMKGSEMHSNMNIILSLTTNTDGTILASIDGGGIVIIDPIQKTVINNSEHARAFEHLDTKAVFSICIDNKGLYWVGTIGKGLRLINMKRNRFQHFKHQPNTPNSLSDNAILSLLEDSKSRIWLGTDGGGLHLFNPQTQNFKNYNQLTSNLKSDVIKRIYEDWDHQLWLGTYGSGLAWLNESKNELVAFTPNTPDNNKPLSISVWSITQQKENKLWIGTLGNGLYEFDTQTKTFTHLGTIFPKLSSVMNDYILSLFVDSKQNLWIGTSNGIYVWYHKQQKYIRYLFDDRNDSGVGKNAILCINESSDGNIWLGSNGGGVFNIDPITGTIENLTLNEGLAQEQVYDITETHPGILWFATHGGLSKYNTKRKRFQNYDSRDGLLGSTFNALLFNHKEDLMVGGVKGLNIFDPTVFKVNSHIPEITLSELYINNIPVKAGDPNSPLTKNIAETKSIVLSHKQNNIGLEFVAINYFRSEKNTYSYKLENASEEWSKASTDRLVKYNNLQPGTYTFHVKAANNDGIWSQSNPILQIKVLAPWWKRWYAYLTYFLLIGGSIYAYIRYTVLWMDMRRKLAFEKMESERIKELNQMRLQFFTNISHEFRTPLTLISGPLQTLKESLKLDPEEQQLFSIADKNTSLLLRLINQLMDFRKAETGSMNLNVSKGNIIAVIKTCAESFRYMAIERQMTYTISSQTDSLIVQFDADIIEKIVYNLLSNAFKYGKENGEVKINIRLSEANQENGSSLSIQVADNGEGIDSHHPEEVFKLYKRFESKHSNITGTGIGLALTKSLVELHGGNIGVESHKEQGTTFTVTIPISEIHEESPSIETSETLVDRDEFNTSYSQETSQPNTGQKRTILLVDDNPQVIQYLHSILHKNYQLSSANNGVQAFDLLMKRSFELVITDLMMPEMDGIELCERIKKELSTSHIPVIMLTAKSSLANRIEGLNTGADAYLPKPFNPDLLKAYINNLFQNRDKLKEIFTSNAIVLPSEVTSNSVDEQFIAKAIKIVRNNLDDIAFGVEEMSKEMGISRSSLSRKLKALTGQSPNHFVRTMRLKEAAARLISSNDHINEIADKTGFNSTSYFIRCFKKEYDMSPGQYKQAHRRWF
ncbi:hybrid sensor histidine kinase/response regulator transcription factor [Sunxiuqinia elliptica]|uniref:histidine kinase n=1 Tax=Sunxiuqinia elliptica TaxID=655355 RepID=A0A1I2L8D0_9BACT|nr:hybrid sensor histidine kinase/response regulator transcription factor [Sunxiuqinia elliptica]SFF73481.1 Two component regulator propeller [Sunxiuqinia elliptica]